MKIIKWQPQSAFASLNVMPYVQIDHIAAHDGLYKDDLIHFITTLEKQCCKGKWFKNKEDPMSLRKEQRHYEK